MNWNELINSKIFDDYATLGKEAANWKKFNEKVVFTNGCFDIIHLGHIDYLGKSADLGDRLIVGINTDASVSKLKGPSRPVIHEHTRIAKIAALAFVDAVVLFGEETPLELIKIIAPDVLVKGGDYSVETIVGADEVLKRNGTVEVIPFLEGHSSTAIIDKIKEA